MARFHDMLDRRWLTNNGPYVQELEAKIQALLGVRHCVSMFNATIALEIAIRALDLSGEVIVPSFTFPATPHSLYWQQITPVFCDIDPFTHNMDPACVEEMITPRTTGIIGVHVWGRPCAVNALSEIAERRGLALLYDAAHAFACSHQGTMIGNFGQAEVLSFHATKFFNSFEGGAVVTNDDALAAKIKLMRNFGFAGLDQVIYIGTNGKMAEPSAAMALTSLESLDRFVAVNRRNYDAYLDVLRDIPGISTVKYDPIEHNNCHYIVMEIDENEAGLSRDELARVLTCEGVLARRYFYPGCHQMEPYRSYQPHAGLLLPETERLTRRVISLPNGTSLGPCEVAKIGAIVRAALAEAPTVRAALMRDTVPA